MFEGNRETSNGMSAEEEKKMQQRMTKWWDEDANWELESWVRRDRLIELEHRGVE